MAVIQRFHPYVLTFIPACLLLVFCLSCHLCPVRSMIPAVIKSANNVHKADNSSDIHWGKLPKTKTIDLPSIKHSDGLEPLFKFSRSFIHSVLNAKLPVELYKKITSGKIDIINEAKDLVVSYVGFLVAVGVGIIFIVIFPFIGLIFCCCRCCGNCGGKMIQNPKSNSNTRRKVLSLLLFLGVAFSASGTALMYASDSRLVDSIKRTPDIVPKSLEVVSLFLNNSYTQFDFLGTETVSFLLEVVKRDLDNLDVLVGTPIRDKLGQSVNVSSIFTTVRSLAEGLKVIVKSMDKAEREIQNMTTIHTKVANDMNSSKSSIETEYNNCAMCKAVPLKTGGLVTTFNVNQLPDISANSKQITSVKFDTQIKKIEDEFNNIPDLVKNGSQAKVQDIKNKLDDIQKNEIDKILKKAKDYVIAFNAGKVANFDLEDLKQKSSRALDMAKPYYGIRSYAFLGLASFCLFIVVILFFGLALGCCGHDDMVDPVNRSCTSNCGGCMLMGAVVLIFLTGSLLMLLTTVMFIPGTVAEVYGCKTLRDIGQGSIDDLLETFTNKTPGQLLFGKRNVDVKISHIYNGCEEGQGLYKAAHLKSIFGLDRIINYPKNNKVREDLTAIQVNMSTIKFMTPEMTTKLRDLKSAMNINFGTFTNELSKIKAPASLDALIVKLDKLVQYEPNFKTHADNVRSIQDNLRTLLDEKTNLVATLNSINQSIAKENQLTEELTDMLSAAQNVTQTQGNTIVKGVLKDFADRFFIIWDGFVEYIDDLLNNKLAVCSPITDIYKYLFLDTACGILDSFNGYWFGLGWYLFFLMFNLIIAVKLAKYFRRMKFSDGFDGSKDGIPLTHGNPTGKCNFPNQNRVGQSPRY